MDIKNFSNFIQNTERQMQQIASVRLSDFEKYKNDLRQIFLDFKTGGEDLVKEGNVLKIGVVGQVKAGKSSFLNSLFFEGESVLPKASTPMTAGLTVLEYAEENSFEVEYYSADDWKEFQGLDMLYRKVKDELLADPKYKGAPESVIQFELKNRTSETLQSGYELVSRCGTMARNKIGTATESVSFKCNSDLQRVLNEYVGVDGEYTSVVKSLVIHLKDERLKGIRIVDTPGVNDPIVSRENRTRQFLHSCHGVFFLSYSSRFFDSMDSSFMNTRIGGQGVGTVLLLASKYDDVLQDQGLEYADDLDGADTTSRRALEKRFRQRVSELDNRQMDIRFDTTSGICYALANKPCNQWDEIEKHVAQQLKHIYPSAFQDEKMAHETFLALANLDVVREDYLGGMFKKNKEQIIQQKVTDYFQLNTEALREMVDEGIMQLEEKRKELNTVGLASLKKQKENQKHLFQSLKADFSLTLGDFQNSLQTEVKDLKENIEYPSCWKIPMLMESVYVTYKGFIFSSSNTFDVKQVDTEQLHRDLISVTKRYEEEYKSQWRTAFEKFKKKLFESFCQKITEFSKNCEDLSFSDSYYRKLISMTLSNIDIYKILETKTTLLEYQEKFVHMCNSQELKISDQKLGCKEGAVQGILNKMSLEIEENIRGDIQTQLKYFAEAIWRCADQNCKHVLPQLAELRKNIDQKLVEVGNGYLKKLEEDLKNKEAVEQEILKMLDLLNQLRNNFKGK